MAYYIHDGETCTGIILEYDQMFVSSGGTANSTIINTSGYLEVDSGGTAKPAQTVGIIVSALKTGSDPEAEKSTVPRAVLLNHFCSVRLISSEMIKTGRFLTCEKIFPM